MANSKRHWLWLAKTYEERLRLYWADRRHTEVERNSGLLKALAEEKIKRQKSDDKVERYESAHQRWVKLTLTELSLPPPPVRAEVGPKKAPICVLDDDAAAAPAGDAPQKKKARVR